MLPEAGTGLRCIKTNRMIYIEEVMAYAYLFIAIIAEVVGTSTLKASNEFKNRTGNRIDFAFWLRIFQATTGSARDCRYGINYFRSYRDQFILKNDASLTV